MMIYPPSLYEDRMWMGSCILPFGHILRTWNSSLWFVAGLFSALSLHMDLLDGLFLVLPFLFGSWRNTRPLHRRARPVVSHSFCPRPHIITTHVYAHRPSPGVLWSLASLVLVVTHYCLISSLASPSSFLFSSCFPRSWVIIRVFVFCLCPFISLVLSLSVSVFRSSLSRQEAVGERNSV